jgi:hypothetical protein
MAKERLPMRKILEVLRLRWVLGHVSRGMYTTSGQRKAYSQVAAVQVGFLMDRGVLRWEADTVSTATARGARRLARTRALGHRERAALGASSKYEAGFWVKGRASRRVAACANGDGVNPPRGLRGVEAP